MPVCTSPFNPRTPATLSISMINACISATSLQSALSHVSNAVCIYSLNLEIARIGSNSSLHPLKNSSTIPLCLLPFVSTVLLLLI